MCSNRFCRIYWIAQKKKLFLFNFPTIRYLCLIEKSVSNNFIYSNGLNAVSNKVLFSIHIIHTSYYDKNSFVSGKFEIKQKSFIVNE